MFLVWQEKRTYSVSESRTGRFHCCTNQGQTRLWRSEDTSRDRQTISLFFTWYLASNVHLDRFFEQQVGSSSSKPSRFIPSAGAINSSNSNNTTTRSSSRKNNNNNNKSGAAKGDDLVDDSHGIPGFAWESSGEGKTSFQHCQISITNVPLEGVFSHLAYSGRKFTPVGKIRRTSWSYTGGRPTREFLASTFCLRYFPCFFIAKGLQVWLV